MPVRAVPSFLQAGSHPAEETRLMMGGMIGIPTGSFAGGIAAADPGHGIVRTTDLAVTANGTPNMSVNVAAGGAFIRGTESANQGVYHLWNDGTINLPIAAADPTNARRDLVIAQVRDAGYSGANNDARIIVVTGTPAASPADPSLASFPNALVLARITVAAADTSIVTGDITDLRTMANTRHILPVVTSTTLRDMYLPTPFAGQGVYLDTGDSTEGIQFYNGSAWRLPWNMPWGHVALATSTVVQEAETTTYVDVTSATWTGTPVANRRYRVSGHFFAQAQTASPGNARFAIRNGSNTVLAFRDAYSAVQEGRVAVVVPYFFTTTATSTTLKLSFNSQNSVRIDTLGVDDPLHLHIEDIGPAGAPA